MSLSSLLLGKSAPIDTELDTLFKAPVAKPPVAGPSKESSAKKRKLDQETGATTEENTVKRSKASKEDKRPKKDDDKAATSKKKVADVKSPKAEKKQKEETKKNADKKADKKAKGKGKEVAVESDEDDEELENAYLAGRVAAVPTATKEGEDDSDKEGDVREGDDDEAPANLVHESVEKKTKKVRAAKTKFVPQDETSEQRDLRTIFIGNLPLETASKKPLQKQLKNHILSFVPTAKIESIRFRSIPFQVPTAQLPDADGEGGAAATTKKPAGPRKEAREHVKERTSQWRSKQDEQDEESLTKDDKRFLNPAQKKKIAFINQEFHATAGTVNAYMVFAHPPNTENRPANLPPLPPTMDPYQAARTAAEKCDGTFCLERMLRVDMVVKNKGVAAALPSAEASASADAEEAAMSALLETDPRLSIFVGNLDFASKEEDLRVFFEGVVTTERGAPPAVPQEDGAEDAAASKPTTWVTRVRIVRDKDTQLGKGFAYVQFTDRECVDEVLALEETKLKFAKRKLRVQRCKSAPGGKNAPNVNNDKRDKSKSAKAPRPAVVVPKGDPRLGEKLHGLPKEERKQLKSADADRVARRLAKKKARMSMAPGVGKEKGKGKGKGKGAGKGTGKERKRVRS